MTACARGCTQKIEGGKEPRPAEIGNLCARTRENTTRGCADKLERTLHDIETEYAALDGDPSAAPRVAGARVTHQKISGSPAGARLDVIVMRDNRTTGQVRDDAKKDFDPKAQLASAPTLVVGWAANAAEDLKLATVEIHSLTDGVAFLTGPWFENICYLEWIEALYDEATDLARTLRRLNGKGGARPIGQCQCGSPIYQPAPRPGVNPSPDSAVIECRDCGHRMNALAIIRLAALQRSTVNEVPL